MDQSMTIEARDIRAARRVLALPMTGRASVRRSSAASKFAYACYHTAQGDTINRMPRSNADFRSACAHLGVKSYDVTMLMFVGSRCLIHTHHGVVAANPRRLAPSWLARLADRIWKEEV